MTDPIAHYPYSLARTFKVNVKVIGRWIRTGKLPSTVDSLGRRGCTNGQLRHFILRYGRETAEEDVDRLRRAIFETYRAHPHAFEHGCGRETMASYVYGTTEVRHSPRAIRRAIDEIAAEGAFTRGTSDSGHTTYHMFPGTPTDD